MSPGTATTPPGDLRIDADGVEHPWPPPVAPPEPVSPRGTVQVRHPAVDLSVPVEVEHLHGRDFGAIHRAGWLPEVPDLQDDRQRHAALLDAVATRAPRCGGTRAADYGCSTDSSTRGWSFAAEAVALLLIEAPGTEDAEWVVRGEHGDVVVVEDDPSREEVELQGDRCGRWTRISSALARCGSAPRPATRRWRPDGLRATGGADRPTPEWSSRSASSPVECVCVRLAGCPNARCPHCHCWAHRHAWADAPGQLFPFRIVSPAAAPRQTSPRSSTGSAPWPGRRTRATGARRDAVAGRSGVRRLDARSGRTGQR
jgi:hypothetical protein